MKFIITIVICAVYTVGIWYLVRSMRKTARTHIFVHPGNKYRYYADRMAKLKNPSTGEWHEAIIYKGIDDGNIYVRDKRDFINKFIPIEEWEKITK